MTTAHVVREQFSTAAGVRGVQTGWSAGQSRPAAVSHHHGELHHITSHSGSTPPLHNPVRFRNVKGGGASLICLHGGCSDRPVVKLGPLRLVTKINWFTV